MEYKDIPLMNWGIVDKHNYDGKPKSVPTKKIDPNVSYEITLNGSDIGKHVGRFSFISHVRISRPKTGNDVFGPIIRGEDDENAYGIAISGDSERLQDPFSIEPKIENLTEYNAITYINRYPAMVRVLDPEIEKKVIPTLDKFTKVAKGINLVTTTTEYYDNLSNMPLGSLTSLLESMKTAIDYCIDVSRENTKTIHISPFFNLGKKAGGSIDQVHSQVYIDLTETGHGPVMETALKAGNDDCRICGDNHGDRYLYGNDGFDIWVAEAPIRNYNLRFAPQKHITNITDLNENIRDMAEVILVGFRALDEIGVERDRNIGICTRPFGYTSEYHLYGDIIPFEPVGAFEITDTMKIARIDPDDAAKQLREAIDSI